MKKSKLIFNLIEILYSKSLDKEAPTELAEIVQRSRDTVKYFLNQFYTEKVTIEILNIFKPKRTTFLELTSILLEDSGKKNCVDQCFEKLKQFDQLKDTLYYIVEHNENLTNKVGMLLFYLIHQVEIYFIAFDKL